MRFVLALAMCCVLLSAPLLAQPTNQLRIAGETKYAPHQLVKLRVEGVPEGAGVLWRVHPDSGIERADTAPELFQGSAHPGDYTVEVLAISMVDGRIKIHESRVKITVSSCSPPAPPGPTPPQPNPPAPNPPGPGKLDPSNAIGKIQFGNAGCSATVIGPRRADGRWNVVTAAHCNSGVGQSGKMTMPLDGKVYGVRVVVHNKTSDLCWMVTEQSIDEICYALMADANPAPGTAVWHQGYGFDRPRNREDGVVKVSENSSGMTQFNLNVSSGDSGGGIFRADDNRWVSAVCCTVGIAQKVDMWGGSLARAKTLLGGVADRYDPDPAPRLVHPIERLADTWQPVQIPVVK